MEHPDLPLTPLPEEPRLTLAPYEMREAVKETGHRRTGDDLCDYIADVWDGNYGSRQTISN